MCRRSSCGVTTTASSRSTKAAPHTLRSRGAASRSSSAPGTSRTASIPSASPPCWPTSWTQRSRRCARRKSGATCCSPAPPEPSSSRSRLTRPCGARLLLVASGNPHAGVPFSDDDAAIARALDDVSVPALLCSLVHMTGDLAWIRSDLRPRLCSAVDFQGGMRDDAQTEVRRRALPAVAAYRDAGCEPHPLTPEAIHEMMEFVACAPIDETRAAMMADDLSLDGADAGAVTWAGEIPEAVRHDSHVVVIGCGESGVQAGIRLAQAGLPFTIVEKADGPGGTWRHNRYPGARVDVGSHHYCYSFEPADHWSEYFCRQPELVDYFTRILDKHGLREHCRFDTEVTAAEWDEEAAQWRVRVRNADGTGHTIDARFVISAVGALSLPRWPDIEGMDSFAGPWFHSTQWPADVD